MLNLLNTLVLVGSLQGFIVGALFLCPASNPLPKRLMGALLVLIAMASLNVFLNEQAWYRASAFCQMLDALFPFILPMAFGPLLYFYVQATLEMGFTLKRRHFVHFLPVVIDLFPYVFAAVYLGGIWANWLPDHTGRAGRIIDAYNVYADIPRWLSLTAYIAASVRYFRPRKDLRGAAWIRECLWVFSAFQVLWLTYLVPYVIPRYTYWMLDRFHWYPVFLPLGILTYWFGIKGFTFAYPRTRFNGDDFDIQVALLRRAMEEGGLYLDPRLSLDRLADRVGLPAKTVSSALNGCLRKNFSEFINEYRIRAFQERLRSGKYEHLTIAGLAAECGFNSHATFQRIFKEYTGLTPSAYRKSAQIRN